MNVKLQDILCGKKTTQKSLVSELSYNNPWGLCGRKMTAKIEEFPAKKEMASGQHDAFLTSNLFLLI